MSRLNFLLALLLLVPVPQSYARSRRASTHRRFRRRKRRKRKRRISYSQPILIVGAVVIVVFVLVYVSSSDDNTRSTVTNPPPPITNTGAPSSELRPIQTSKSQRNSASLPFVDLKYAETTVPSDELINRYKEHIKNIAKIEKIDPDYVFPKLIKPNEVKIKKLPSKKLITDELKASFDNKENVEIERKKFKKKREEVIKRKRKHLKTKDSAENDPSFMTLEGMKLTLWVQYVNFKRWAEKKAWNMFEIEHYDWWEFACNHISSNGKNAYAVSFGELVELLKDGMYKKINNLGTDYVFQSLDWWGVKDNQRAKKEKDPPKELIGNKRWEPSPERMAKILHSLLFANEFERYRIAFYFAWANYFDAEMEAKQEANEKYSPKRIAVIKSYMIDLKDSKKNVAKRKKGVES